MTISRRSLIGSAAVAAGLAASGAHAQPQRLNIYSHRVHRTVATGTQGGDITAAWSQRTGIGVEWVTFDTGPLQERLFREASLRETSVDIGFLLNTQTVPRIATLFEPLDDYMARDPVEDRADIFPGMLQGMTIGGKLYGLPFRHASSGLHYNDLWTPPAASWMSAWSASDATIYPAFQWSDHAPGHDEDPLLFAS